MDRKPIARAYIADLNELFAIAQTRPSGDAYADTYRKIGVIGYNREGCNIVGAYMAAQIERELGRDALIATIRDGYQAFPDTYNRLVDDEMQIRWSPTP